MVAIVKSRAISNRPATIPPVIAALPVGPTPNIGGGQSIGRHASVNNRRSKSDIQPQTIRSTLIIRREPGPADETRARFGRKTFPGLCQRQKGAPVSEQSPIAEYERRRSLHAVDAVRLERRERLAGRLRIATFIGIVGLFLFLPISVWAVAWLAPAVMAFVCLIAWHRRVVIAHAAARRSAAYLAHGLARLQDQWRDSGPTGESYAGPAHPYAGDLDIFGRGSLVQYLCDAHTPVGQDMLASWLRAPADPETIRARQTAVAELRPDIDTRKAAGILGDFARPAPQSRALLTWPEARPVLTGRLAPILAYVLGLLGVAGIVAWVEFGTGPSPLLLIVMVEVIVLARYWQRIREVTRDARILLIELDSFLPILQFVERRAFKSPLLQSVHRRLTEDGDLPSRRVARLAKLLDNWDTVTRNQFVLPFAIVLMVPMHLAFAIDRWRQRDGRRVRAWLDAVGEFEAVCSLSAFAYEHPEYAFPEIVSGPPCVEAEALAHPLLPANRRAANDVRLGSEPALLLVSGSNMSGKSTLMRAVGVNVVLALAGGPVCATRMRVSRVQVATAMRQADSLSEGVSAFYAEIRRLQTIRDLASGPLPVLFLLDEILRGTNSHDRRIGAEAVVRILLERGAVGMVSTHDLALAEIVDRLGPTAANVHFEDQLKDGQVTFDYRLRPGVVPRGNGLVLLRLLGFKV
jgi:hypothetical protein